MDTFLGGAAFAAMMLAHVAAVIAVHRQKGSREREAPPSGNGEYRGALIPHPGYR